MTYEQVLQMKRDNYRAAREGLQCCLELYPHLTANWLSALNQAEEDLADVIAWDAD